MTTELEQAVEAFWQARSSAQSQGQATDRGRRSAATSGAQLDAVTMLIVDFILAEGDVSEQDIKLGRRISVLPGFFRPEKAWDLVVMKGSQLGAVIELKSHIGPSFGNNFNNRAEEAIGNASDFWTAYREGAFTANSAPWVGYFMLLEDHLGSRRPVTVSEPLFKVFADFKDASYMVRYELLLRRLKLERLYDATALVTATDPNLGGLKIYQPAPDLAFEPWLRSLAAHLRAV